MNLKRQPFISIEGMDGAGKSTVKEAIVKLMEDKGFEVLQTREPGGTYIGEKIREIIIRPNDYGEVISPETETLLFYAARVQNTEQIKRILSEGRAVLSDRFADSTFAYQSARGQKIEDIQKIHDVAIGDFKPDITIYLDIDFETSLRRLNALHVSKSANGKDRLERELPIFFNKARDTFLDIAKNDPKRFVMIDARQTELEVKNEVIEKVSKKLDEFIKKNEIKKKRSFNY